MTQQKESVVTPERFAQGKPYDQWLTTIERNLDRLNENYAGTTVSDDDGAALKDIVGRPNGAAKCLALGESWCPDVFRGLPVMARIAEASGMELRVFDRDQNNDIMAEFLKNGEHESIPTFVFYTKGYDYIAHWIERPVQANDEMPQLRDLTAPLRNADLTPEEREKHIQAYIDFQNGPVWGGWRDATIRESRQLLEDKIS